MKRTVLLGAVIAAAATLAGCATKQFAQVGDLTDYEKSTMSCREIDLEVAKTQGVQQTIDKEAQFDGRSVLAFLGDFGIGNSMAKSSAESSVTKRMNELQAMRAQKNCPLSTAAAN